MSTRVGSEGAGQKAALGTPEIRRLLVDFVKRRVAPADVDDVVQTILVDALAAPSVPGDRDELRKWLIGVARHKVADVHRKGKREVPVEAPEQEAPPAPIEVREMVRWAEDEAGSTRDARQTLDWMAREGEGEKLENIAADEKLPAARVRQRVSRLRRWMKQRWLAELAAVAALAILAVVAYRLLRGPKDAPEAILPDPVAPPSAPLPPLPVEPSPQERARAMRDEARQQCGARDWEKCLERLDAARALDAAGDGAPEVKALRQQAEDALLERRLQEKNEKTQKIDDAKSKPIAPKAPPPTSTSTPSPPPLNTAPPPEKKKFETKPQGPKSSGKTSSDASFDVGQTFGTGSAPSKGTKK